MNGKNTNQTTADAERDRRVGEILNDFIDRRDRGEVLAEEALLARHPELADELAEHLDLLRGMEADDATVRGLVSSGVLSPGRDSRYLAELGPYRITGFLGRGGMGIVLKAYEERLNRSVALKLLRPELAQDRAAVHRFAREAKAAAGVDHANIVTIYSVGEARGTSYIAMEYFDGPTLADVLRRRGPLGRAAAREVFRKLLEGLAVAHEAGFVHRDIKPSNILVKGLAQGGREAGDGTDGAVDVVVKIADFGLARVLSSQTRVTMPESLLGTPEYMSPEQARGDENIDHRSDLYAAGVVLYEMITGRTPFRAESPSAVVHQILYDDPPDPKLFSHEADPMLTSLALRLMAKAANDRFATASEALDAIEDGKRVRYASQRWRFVHRRRVVLVALAVLCLAVPAAIWGINSSRHSRSTDPMLIEWVGTEEDSANRILARRRGSVDQYLLYEFPTSVKRIARPEIVNLGDDRPQLIVAGIEPALGTECLFAFTSDGQRLWSISLSDGRHWPDCVPPLPWHCLTMEQIVLPGSNVPQLVVAATERQEYPTRVTIIDPFWGKKGATYWHMGKINQLLVAENLLGPKHPAIIAWGLNNKLDGFDDELRAGEKQYARWDLVPVVMILDPLDMEGLGPPKINRMASIPAARPLAYAFLDLPYTRSLPAVTYDARTRQRRVQRAAEDYPWDDMGNIMTLEVTSAGRTPDAAFLLDVVIAATDSDNNNIPRATLRVNADLVLQDVIPNTPSGEIKGTQKAYWNRYWHPIIQRGKYVDATRFLKDQTPP